ncbi:hypothetical protein V2H45_02475 [Tumidithrix elongata RA019]|uniref:Uncharacterized protein n=1 Tax=Tumidithrix elongata BACA0141 TaxID=2716417 RepID=A0AAW9PYH1_9CYAN|nr:hypothetical protein [Tumidithrix elongata RA019]
MGRYDTSDGKKPVQQVQHNQPAVTGSPLQMRPFAPYQETQAQSSAPPNDRTQELGHRLENISFAPRPQVDIMARKWEGIKAAYQAKIQAKQAIGTEPEVERSPEQPEQTEQQEQVVQRSSVLSSEDIPIDRGAIADTSIQRLMSAEDFKKATSVKFHRRNRIAKIDEILEAIEKTGADRILLSELLDAIDDWLKVADEESDRREGVNKLRQEATAEIEKIGAPPSEDMDSAPKTRQRSNAFSAKVTGAGKEYGSDFSDFDSKQFRISGRAPKRTIEEVKRKQMEDGTVMYFAMGLVTGFNDKAPMIAPYPEPISLGDWYPKVTHINGMAVAPKSGILSAAALQESVNQALDGQDDMAVGQSAIDVLYTYSAQRGNPLVDVWDCLKGKVEVRDEATEKQEEIMLDAVHRQERVTVSAHSRGTIKTDNAVRNVHEKLIPEFLPEVKQNRWQEVLEYWQANDPGIGLDPEDLAEISLKGFAAEAAKKAMNKYIQLIYAGNAVQHPSALVDINMYVGGLDVVSMFVGTYSETGRKIDAAIGTGGTKGSKLHSVGTGKGHGFVDNYVPAVGSAIASDIQQR